PKSELYGLVSQMRRASISIPSNIAEGYKRKNLGEYVQFLSIADASAAELETQLIISKDLYNNINFSRTFSLLEEVQKMLITLIKKLNPKPSTLNPNKGQVLIEAMVAMSIATVGLLGAFALLSSSLRLNRDVNDKFIAVNLATEGLEIVKNLLRHNAILTYPWNAGECLLEGSHEMDWNEDGENSQCTYESPNGKFLKFDSATGLYSYDNGDPSKYKREITVSWPGPPENENEIRVNVIVRWDGIGGAKYEINLEDHFFNWLTQCNDGLDNDGDNKFDQQDDNCSAPNDPFEG
ncbi:MAG: four helix bundle protein, partial [Candidatus Harrisonbacteria bacterium]|nr:four helix bundle protein [Candidatus Harrisonbacteria bacterium]